MRKTIALLAVGFLLAVGGCKNDNKDESMSTSSSSSEPKKMTTDVCSHCPGVQTATTEGKCSGCGAKL